MDVPMFHGITDLTTFILGTIFIVLLPGPNSLYVMAAERSPPIFRAAGAHTSTLRKYRFLWKS